MLDPFIEEEIRKLKRLRLMSIVFLLSTALAIVGFFGYLAAQNYIDRQIQDSFWLFAGLPLLYLSLIIFLPLLAVSWMISKRFKRTFRQLEGLHEPFVTLYQDYCRLVPRLYPGIPSYLFTQDGLVIPGNFRDKLLTKQDFDQLRISKVRKGRGIRLVLATLYQGNKRVARLEYHGHEHPTVDFLLQHISLVHPTVTIER